MTTHRFRHVPVVERGRLIGLVSIGDLVKIHVADAEFELGDAALPPPVSHALRRPGVRYGMR